jgi:hypothetical protein
MLIKYYYYYIIIKVINIIITKVNRKRYFFLETNSAKLSFIKVAKVQSFYETLFRGPRNYGLSLFTIYLNI